MDGSYLNRWASWVAQRLVAGTVGACSWPSTADRGGPAFDACAEPSVWDSAPLPEPRRGRLEVPCATLMVAVGHAGRSAPIRCGVLPGDQAVVATPSLLTHSGFTAMMALLQTQAQYFGDCAAALAPDATAWDLDLVRAALGEDVTFVGWSYGARLGAGDPLANADTVVGFLDTALREADDDSFYDMVGCSPCVARQVTPYLVEVGVPGGHGC